ncbi:hypothetical protein AB0B85_27490 [Micromonospora sp. NPDC049044]|uniref:hypothetical protein n=1 Tax=unclassified Micromonospora TaxID=2617518 RepID=UPI0033E87D24
MPPRRHPRNWLAGRLRSAAGAVQRLAGWVEPAGHPPPPDAPTAAPRRFGEPPQHWLDLVAAHAPGLLHDVDLARSPHDSDDAPVADQPGDTGLTGVDAAGPTGHGPSGSTTGARGSTSATGPAAAGGRGFAGRGGTRPANRTGRSDRAAPPAADPRTGDAYPAGPGTGNAYPAGTGTGDAFPTDPGTGDAGPGGTGVGDAGLARTRTGNAGPGHTGTGDAHPAGTRLGDGGSVGGSAPRVPALPDTSFGRGGPGAATGPEGSVRPDGWGDGMSAPARTPRRAARVPRGSRWSDPTGGGGPGAPRPVPADPAGSGDGQFRSRPGSADHRRGSPAGPAPGRARTSRPGVAAGSGPAPDPADEDTAWPGSAGSTVPSGVRGTTIDGPATGEWPWPALPDEAARPRPPGGAPLGRYVDQSAAPGGRTWTGGGWHDPSDGGRSTGTEPRAATPVGSPVPDRWPALPDDATLWTVPADALDTAQLGRLDREQAGG